MDYNKGKTDFLIGSVIVPIKLGVGKVILSRLLLHHPLP